MPGICAANSRTPSSTFCFSASGTSAFHLISEMWMIVFGVPKLFFAAACEACQPPKNDPAQKTAAAASAPTAKRSFEFMSISQRELCGPKCTGGRFLAQAGCGRWRGPASFRRVADALARQALGLPEKSPDTKNRREEKSRTVRRGVALAARNPPPEIPVLFAAAFTERLATVDGEREGATRVRQGEARLFHLNAACLVGFAIPE